ncbi:hypothetical protein [Nocardiopsis sp. CNR-923]|uniref:hypothetical protein n=1 Tax=Nocardiopsis sp. CNR-923 TaxID=1904965 RepID=UPI0021CCF047|nr:hypothetical protein [Nocardiopsis sp. CNR-923]
MTSGTVAHDAAGVLTATTRIRLPGRFPRWRTAGASLTVDTGAWYAALATGTTDPPVRLTASHTLVDVTAWLSPAPRADGRWDVTAVLDVRGRGLIARPLVAMLVWAIRASFRREQRHARRGEGTGAAGPRERWERAVRSWDRVAHQAWRIPEFLHEVAKSMAEAQLRD